MSSVLVFPQIDQVPEIIPSGDDGVRSQVWGVLAGLYPRGRVPERRAVQRFPYPQLLYLTPVGDDLRPNGETVAVVGKHLSESGLGFYHVAPLPYRRMIASLELPEANWAGFLIDLKWCRFTRYGWYDSGGRFLQTVVSPMAPHAA